MYFIIITIDRLILILVADERVVADIYDVIKHSSIGLRVFSCLLLVVSTWQHVAKSTCTYVMGVRPF